MDQETDKHNTSEKQVIEVLKEEIKISKELVETGKVIVHKEVETHVENHKIQLMSEDLDVKRIQINKKIDSMPVTRTEGDVTIIPVVREVAVVTKILMLMEEVHITRKSETKTEELEIPVRKESIDIKRQDV